MDKVIDVKRQEEAFEKLKKEKVYQELNEFSEIIMGQSPKSEYYNESGVGKAFIQGNADIKNRKTAPRMFSKHGTKETNENNIIMSVRAPVGTVAISTNNYYIGRGVCSINSKYNRYIFQYLLWHEDKWDKYSTGSTFDSIDSKTIRELKVLLYEKYQNKIANFLTSIDELIQKQEEYIEELKVQKKGYSQKIFNQELRFKGFEEKWLIMLFTEIYQKDKINTKYSKKKYEACGKIPIISQEKEFINGYTNDDVVINKNNIVLGDHTLNLKKCFFDFITGGDGVILLSSTQNLEYAYYALEFNLPEPEGYKRHFSILKELKFSVPSLGEQKVIGNFLSALDDKIELQEQKLKQLKQKKKYYLNKIFQ